MNRPNLNGSPARSGRKEDGAISQVGKYLLLGPRCVGVSSQICSESTLRKRQKYLFMFEIFYGAGTLPLSREQRDQINYAKSMSADDLYSF